MPVEKLKKFLDNKEIRYISIFHSPAYTSYDISKSAHVSSSELAKSVIVHLDRKLAIAVIPGNSRLDLPSLLEVSGCKKIHLATEKVFQSHFPGCELGAMPPFGNLYGMDTYVSESMKSRHEIVFNAGTHKEVIRINFSDFLNLVHPRIAQITQEETLEATV